MAVKENDTEVIYENMIHDIKTPLMIMYMNNQFLENMKNLPDNAYDTLKSMKRNWYRIMKIVTDASDTGKINNGKLMPKYRNWDLVALLKDITEATKILADRKKISLMFSSNVKEKTTAIDKDMLERIVLNLLSNAFKYTGIGGKVEIIFTEIKDNLNIIVRNDGTDTNFESYEQEESTVGIGLGLSIVTQLCALLGGGICINRLPAGSEILVSLPSFVLDDSPEESKFYDDFYADNIVQIELSDEYM